MNEKQIMEVLGKLGLLEHPTFITEVSFARQTGNWKRLSDRLTIMTPQIEQAKMTMEYQNYLAGIDPFFPRPYDDEFPGDIGFAYVLDPLTGTPQSLFKIGANDLVIHTSIFGGTGTGKTNAEKCIIRSILGTVPNVRIWIFDPQRTYRNCFHPEFVTLGFNDFIDETFDKPTTNIPQHTWYNKAIQMLATEQYFQTTGKFALSEIIKFMEKEPHYRFPRHRDILKVIKKFKANSETFKTKDTYESLLNRFSGLNNFENHCRNARIPTKDLMQHNVIFEWGDELKEIQVFRTALLITKLYMLKKYEPSDIINVIVIDEARSMFGYRSDSWGESLLEETFTRSRHMKIGFMVITQEPSSISKVIKANSNTTIAFPVADIEKHSIQQGMLLTPEQFGYYDHELAASGKGAAIARYAPINRPFPVQFPLYPDPEPLPSEADIRALKDRFILPYDLPVETPIKTEKTEVNVPPNAIKLIKTLIDNPFLKTADLYKACELQTGTGTKAKKWLINNNFATEERVRIRAKGPAPMFTMLNSKAYKHLNLKTPSWGKRSFTHRLYQHLVAKRMKEKGWTVTIEKRTTNKQSQHPMDVFCTKDGVGRDYEITLHRENLGENIVKGFMDDDVHEVIIVTKDKSSQDKCRKETQDEQKQFGDKLKFQTIDKFYLKKGASL